MNKPQPKKPLKRLHHITRLDNEIKKLHAWHVNVMRNKQKTDKHFSDSAHGGKKKSLQAAIQYRDELLKQTDVYALLVGYGTSLQSNNKSGIAGVYRADKINKRSPNTRHIYWVAYGKNEYGVRYCCRFSIKLYGEAGARQMAIDERERQLKRVCAILAAREDAHIYASYTFKGRILNHDMIKKE